MWVKIAKGDIGEHAEDWATHGNSSADNDGSDQDKISHASSPLLLCWKVGTNTWQARAPDGDGHNAQFARHLAIDACHYLSHSKIPAKPNKSLVHRLDRR